MHRLVLAFLLALLMIPAGQAMAQSTPAAGAPVVTSQEPQAGSQDAAVPAQAEPTQTTTTPDTTDTDTTPQENTDDPDQEEFGEDVEDQPEEQPEPAQEAAPPPAPAPAPAPVLPRTGGDPAVLIAALSLFLLGMALRRVTRPA